MQYKILLLCLMAVVAYSAKDTLTTTAWHRPPVEFLKAGAGGEFSKRTVEGCANTGNNNTVALYYRTNDGNKRTYTVRTLNLTAAPTLAGSENSFTFDTTTMTTYNGPNFHIDGRVFWVGFKDDSSAKAQLHVTSGFVNGSSLTDKTYTNWTDAVLSATLGVYDFTLVSHDIAILIWHDATKTYGNVLNLTSGTTGAKFNIVDKTPNFISCRRHAVNATYCYYVEPVTTPTVAKVFTVNATTSTASTPATVFTDGGASLPRKTYTIGGLAVFKDFVAIVATETVIPTSGDNTYNVVMKLSNNTGAEPVALKTGFKNNFRGAQEYFDQEILLSFSTNEFTASSQNSYSYSRNFLNGTSSASETSYLVVGSQHTYEACAHGTWGAAGYLLYKRDTATPTPAITSVEYGAALNATHVFGAALKTAFSVVVLAIAAIFTL